MKYNNKYNKLFVELNVKFFYLLRYFGIVGLYKFFSVIEYDDAFSIEILLFFKEREWYLVFTCDLDEVLDETLGAYFI